LAYCRQAKTQGADLVVFPELWNVGYRLPATAAEVPRWQASALALEGPYVAAFRALARELDLAIGLTLLESYHPLPRNSLLLIDRHGGVVLHYAKVHTCSFAGERWLTPGTEFVVADLDTCLGPVRVGAMICFDREFPESARVLMLQGAEVIVVPNACEIEDNRRSQLKTRAFENMVAIALANYASGEGNGHSLAFDGVAFEADAAGGQAVSRDHRVAEGGPDAGLVVADFDLDVLRRYRSEEVWGPRHRQVGTYLRLVVPSA